MAAQLQGQRILVTGAARRIGKSIALKLAAEGARVLIHYNSSEEEARRVSELAGDARAFRADLESVAEIKAMFREIEDTVGGLDGLVNNAGRFTELEPLEITEKDWDFIHSVNLKAVFFCCQQAARIMRSGGGGRIVNISSLGGIRPWADHVHYCASKAGVIHMTRALAIALAPAISLTPLHRGSYRL
jgi:3-oxoacyl-[acyl-carrier protein] reductase/pteridine reductase